MKRRNLSIYNRNRNLKMKQKRICISVLTYDNYLDTKECLESLMCLEDDFHEILLVDNGSTDGSIEKIQSQFPEVSRLSLTQNVGVPSGFNLGILYAFKKGFDYIFILNNDTIVAPDILIELLKATDIDSSCGLVMPQVLYYPPTEEEINRENIWSDGGYFRMFPPGIVQKDIRKDIDFNVPRKIEFAPACGILIPMTTFRKVGLFDPDYFFFFEDWDFSIRVREAGLNLWCFPNAKLWHKVSRSTGKNDELFWRILGESTIRFYRRHYSFFSSILQIIYRIIRDFIYNGNFRNWNSFSSGMQVGLRANINPYPNIENLNNYYNIEVNES